MKEEIIAEIGIDGADRLYVRPTSSLFPAIYRSAMEVHWDPERQVLYSPEPREWDYPRWFEQILSAVADEYGIILKVAQTTRWTNVADEYRQEMESYSRSNRLAEAMAERKRLGAGYWGDMLTKQTLDLAASAWERGDYRKYVDTLTPIRAKLSAAQLKRLAIAERRVGAGQRPQ